MSLRGDALDRREQRAQSLFDQIADAVVLVDAAAIIQDCNTAALRMFGYSEQGLVGRDATMLLSDPDAVAVLMKGKGSVADRDAGPDDAPVRVLARRCDGLTFPVEVSVGSAKISGAVMYAATFREASEKARLESELSRAELESDNASQLTHRITELVGESSQHCLQEIAELAGSLSGSGHRADQQTCVSALLQSVRALRTSVDEISTLIDTGTECVDGSGVAFSPDLLVEECVAIAMTDAVAAGVEIITFLDPDVPAQLYGDPAVLRDVLQHLLRYAAKRARPGGLGVEVRVKEREGSDIKLQLSVSGSSLFFTHAV